MFTVVCEPGFTDPRWFEQVAIRRSILFWVFAVLFAACDRRATREPVPNSASASTQRLWLPYREAWVALGAKVRPDTHGDGWRVWITRKRTRMLTELAAGC